MRAGGLWSGGQAAELLAETLREHGADFVPPIVEPACGMEELREICRAAGLDLVPRKLYGFLDAPLVLRLAEALSALTQGDLRTLTGARVWEYEGLKRQLERLRALGVEAAS